MTRSDVIGTLEPLIEEMDGEEIIVTARYEDGRFKFISVDDFVNVFGEKDLTLSSLMTHPLATSPGWGDTFTEWYNRGILPQ